MEKLLKYQENSPWLIIHVSLILLTSGRAGEKPRSDCPGQVNFALGQVKMEVWWPGGQVKLASAVLLVIIPVKNNLKT